MYDIKKKKSAVNYVYFVYLSTVFILKPKNEIAEIKCGQINKILVLVQRNRANFLQHFLTTSGHTANLNWITPLWHTILSK